MADYTPALGHAALTPLYDTAIALMTRERTWRHALLRQVAPAAHERILDVGCGTGSLLSMIAKTASRAFLFGIDPDDQVLDRAKRKTGEHASHMSFVVGYARDASTLFDDPMDKIVTSLVFHQVPMDEKREGLRSMLMALKQGGELHVADYGLQRTPLMRALFRQIQSLDGVENTTPNAEGVLPRLMAEVGFASVSETMVIPTPTGSISLYRAIRP